MSIRTTSRTADRTAALAMAGAASLAIAGFTALGSVFDYPHILKSSTSEILNVYRAHQGAVTAWFLVLAVGAVLLIPVAIRFGRLAGGRRGRWIIALGIAAATVQVVGLSRWALFVPGISDDATDPAQADSAHHTFRLLHIWLGTVVGETVGYALTAAFTVLVVRAVTSAIAPRWLTGLGYGSAALIATGVFAPFVGIASITNFVGYVAWCVWILGTAVVLWRRTDRPAGELVHTTA